ADGTSYCWNNGNYGIIVKHGVVTNGLTLDFDQTTASPTPYITDQTTNVRYYFGTGPGPAGQPTWYNTVTSQKGYFLGGAWQVEVSGDPIAKASYVKVFSTSFNYTNLPNGGPINPIDPRNWKGSTREADSLGTGGFSCSSWSCPATAATPCSFSWQEN